jgi:hypothetical protein
VKQLLGLALALAPAIAAAQVPIYPGGPPNGSVPDAPRTLDPGSAPTQYTPPPPPPPPPAEKPNVIVIGPDGKPTYTGQQPNEPVGNYVGGGGEGPAFEEPAEVHAGPVPELHVVRRGDTLWDICWYYFNDPWQWPKIWSYNPQITNPHWIYPGDLVRLLPRGVFVEQPGTAMEGPEKGGAGEGAGAGAGAGGKQPDVVPPPTRSSQVGLKQEAFVEKGDLDRSIVIDGAVDEKTLLAIGDQVYLSYPEGKPPQVGKTYSIYEPDTTVKGTDGKEVGAYVHLLGAVQVQSVLKDRRARGVITEATQEIERKAKVGPLAKQYKTVPPVAAKADLQGTIVAMLRKAQLIGQGELVFVNLGKDSGIEVGNRMRVVRRGDALPKQASSTVGQDDRAFPARALGEIVIVEVGEKISAGLVSLSVQEMGVGDTVMMQK